MWNPVWLLVKPWIVNMKLRIPRVIIHSPGLRKYGTTVCHVLHVISFICTWFFNKAWWCHWAHFDWPTTVFPRLATGRSRIASTVIYYSSYVYSGYSHVARHEICENIWITFIQEILTAKILVPCLTVKYTCHEKFYLICCICLSTYRWVQKITSLPRLFVLTL